MSSMPPQSTEDRPACDTRNGSPPSTAATLSAPEPPGVEPDYHPASVYYER
jgi:hypothetical protein